MGLTVQLVTKLYFEIGVISPLGAFPYTLAVAVDANFSFNLSKFLIALNNEIFLPFALVSYLSPSDSSIFCIS